MKLSDSIYMIGSGDAGFSMTNEFDCTMYLVDCGESCALIDAGAGVDIDPILKNICQDGFVPEQISHILLTHGHGDHAGGAWALAQACGAAVYAMEPAAGFIQEGNTQALSLEAAIRAGVYGSDYVFHACSVHAVQDGDILHIGNRNITVIAAEGHSAGHCCYLMDENGKSALFSGDAIITGGKISLQPIWDCELNKYVNTVRKLGKIRPDMLFPGHGCVSLDRGYRHIDKANERLDILLMPSNFIGE